MIYSIKFIQIKAGRAIGFKNENGNIWSEWRDLNPRPLVPQTSALTGLRHTPTR